jgi:flagellar biosynthesis/type III secretory pathway M-ring protein FliF/YscJ
VLYASFDTGELNMDMRVFWSVLAALAVFGVLVIGWRALERERDREDAVAVMQSISDYAGNVVRQGQQAEAQRVWDQHQEQVKAEVNTQEARRLTGNQRCVGGVVVQVDGATYTQLGSIESPVHCSGQYADGAIR